MAETVAADEAIPRLAPLEPERFVESPGQSAFMTGELPAGPGRAVRFFLFLLTCLYGIRTVRPMTTTTATETFTLTITLDPASLSTPDEVADTLVEVANRVRRQCSMTMDEWTTRIADRNGATVGRFGVEVPTEPTPGPEAKRSLCVEHVTLDGAPAVISGYALDFAHLRRLDGVGGAVEFAWPTVARIVANGGTFLS